MRRYLNLCILILLVACSDAVIINPNSVSFTVDKNTVSPGESVTLSWAGIPAGADLSLSPGFIDVTGETSRTITPEQTTNYTLKVTVGSSVEFYTRLVTVLPLNIVPEASSLSKSIEKNKSLTVQLEGKDDDNDLLTYSIVSSPIKGTLSEFNTSTGMVIYTPEDDFVGQDSFSYKVNDGTDDSETATVNITVEDSVQQGSNAPSANSQDLSLSKNTSLAITLTGSDADNDTLSYLLKVAPENGTLSELETSTGQLTYTPNTDYVGLDQFSFVVSDGLLESSEAIIKLVVTEEEPGQNSPVANDQVVTTDEDVDISITLTASDADGDVLTYTVAAQPSKGTLSGEAPNLTYTPDTNESGEDSFSFIVDDGVSNDEATVSITINPVNDAPTANGQTLGTDEDTALVITLSASDLENDVLSYTIVANPGNGSLAGTAPELTYTPNTNFNGSDSFSFKVNDGEFDSETVEVNISVNALNDAPTAADLSKLTSEEIPVDIVLQGNDADGDNISYSITSQPGNGSLSSINSSATLTYTPNAAFSGTDSFKYKVNDGSVDSNEATVTISVGGVNDAPVANSQNLMTNEDTNLSIMLSATDEDGDSLSYSVVSAPGSGSLSGTAPNLTYSPDANYNGTDSFTFKANDGSLDSAITIINITINAVNDAPVADSQSRSTLEDTSLNITLTGSDVEGTGLSFSITTDPGNGNLTGTAPNVTYTPNSNYSGSDSFTFTVHDGEQHSSPATVTISVGVANDVPVANSQSLSTDEDTALSLTLTATDADADPLNYSIVANPSHGSLSGTAPNLTYTPDANYHGSDNFTFKANDGTDDSATATISLTVNGVNDAPEANDLSLTTNEDTVLGLTLSGSDVDGDTLSYEIATSPTSGSLNLDSTSGSVDYTPDTNFNGNDSFTYRVFDGTAYSQTKTVSININAINDAPEAAASAISTSEDNSISFSLSASDVDGDNLTYSLHSDASNGTISISSDGTASYAPNANYNGLDSFTFTANDGNIDSSPATISLTVGAENDAPEANAQSLSTNEDTALSMTLTAADIDGDSLSYSVVSSPTKGSLSGTAPNLTYTPTTNYNGSDSFTFKANDGTMDSSTATISIMVNAVNDAPTATAQSLNTSEDTALSITLSGSDLDLDALSYTIVSNPTKGSLSGTAPNLTYTPNASVNGSDSFTFKVNDGTVDSETATVTITIGSVNDKPIANAQSLNVDEDNTLSITLTGSDEEGSSLSYTVTSPGQGSLSGTAPDLIYTPDANYNGSDSFTFTVNDGELDSDSATISITVNALNDEPTAEAQSITLDEDSSKAITLTASDIEGDSLSYSIVTHPTQGSLSGTAPNLTYTPDASVSGNDSFTFKVNDGTADSATATVSISINSINDKPTADGQSLSVDEDNSLSITLTGSDEEGSNLTYTIVSAPANGSLTGTAPNLTYTPTADYNGSDYIDFKVNDGSQDSDTATVTITVSSINDKPVASAQSLSVDEDNSLSITLSSTDVDGDSLTYTIVTNPTNGSLTGTLPNPIYTPSEHYFGSDSFSFKASDGSLDSDVVSVDITVNSVNDSPTANAQNLSTDKNTALTINLTGTDIEGSSLTYSIVSNPGNGTLSGSGASRTYTPDTDFSGTDSFTFKVNDGSDDSATATISISVADPAPPGIDSFSSNLTLADTGSTVTFSWTVSSSDGDTVSCSLNAGDGTSYTITDCVNTTSKTHTYSTEGFYTASLSATDDDGSDTSDNINMTIATSSTSDYNIHVVFVDDNMTASQKAAFTNAAARWGEIITNDTSGYSSGTRTCSGYSFTGAVDDLVIMAAAPSIDGVSGTLGSAGPCATIGGFPLWGIMKFDIADIASLESSGSLEDVILHEMGHVIGIGTLWSSLIDTTAHTYSGTNGVNEYSTLKGSTQTTVPIEDGGGSGTANGHWEEDVFDHELMTGYLDSGRDNPISRQTIAALHDLGYTVDYSKADSYALPSSFTSFRTQGTKIKLHSELIFPAEVKPDSGE